MSPLSALAITLCSLGCSAQLTSFTVTVSRSGLTSSQVLWFNSQTNTTYLPLVNVASQPFPSLAAVATQQSSPPNTFTHSYQAGAGAGTNDPTMTAFSRVKLIIDSTGAASIDASDFTFS